MICRLKEPHWREKTIGAGTGWKHAKERESGEVQECSLTFRTVLKY